MSTLERLHPEGLPHNLAFSQVVVASGAGDLAEQTAQSMRNIGLALAAAGASYADIGPSSRAGCHR